MQDISEEYKDSPNQNRKIFTPKNPTEMDFHSTPNATGDEINTKLPVSTRRRKRKDTDT